MHSGKWKSMTWGIRKSTAAYSDTTFSAAEGELFSLIILYQLKKNINLIDLSVSKQSNMNFISKSVKYLMRCWSCLKFSSSVLSILRLLPWHLTLRAKITFKRQKKSSIIQKGQVSSRVVIYPVSLCLCQVRVSTYSYSFRNVTLQFL